MLSTGISQMYWITRLTAIQDAFLFAFVASVIAIVIIGIFLLATGDYEDITTSRFYHRARKSFVIAIFLAAFGGLGLTFTPRTSEALLIYGVGTTIDYVDTNETVKQLPAKAIDALDKYLDSLNKDKDD